MRKIVIKKNQRFIECKKCNGTGYESPDPVAAVCTFGLTYLLESIDPDECEYCDGYGHILLETRE